MPIPDQVANALSYTEGGIPYATIRDPGLSMEGADDANMLSIRVIVAWEDFADFTREVVGYAEWDGSSSTLQRTLPLACPLRPGLWCETWRFVKWGGWTTDQDGEPEPNADAFNENWPTAPWLQLQLTFTRPKWWVRSDADLAADWDGKEQFRFAEITRRYTVREQKQPGHYMEVNTAPDGSGTWQTVDIANFTPVYETEIQVRLIGWPIDAFPETLSADTSGCVNSDVIDLGDGFEYPAGRLLYRGLQQPMGWYQNAAGDFVVSPVMVFAYKPGGWNYQLLPTRGPGNARQFGPARLSGSLEPPYPSATFQDLFVPALP
jgi:hypothetical protein